MDAARAEKAEIRRGRRVNRLSERAIEGPDGRTHRLLVNLGESPVSWLHARKMLSQRQYEAAEIIRADWERAALGARVTMNWDSAAAPSGRQRAAPTLHDRTSAQISARDRLNGALALAGPGLSDILWRVVCACESLSAAEQALGWPIRAGKLVLGFALDRVADYYRIGTQSQANAPSPLAMRGTSD
jgi:hypothetical protein